MEKKIPPTNVNNAGTTGGESVFSKVFSKMRVWLDLFMGNPRYKKPAIQGSVEIQSKKKDVAPEEDSVAKDIRSAKGFISETFGRMLGKVQRFSGKKSISGSSQVSSKGVNTDFFKNVVRITIIIFFLIVIVFIALKVYRLLQEGDGSNGSGSYSQPTTVPYKPSKPSVYAEDEDILTLEETLRVLEREIAGTNIRESVLTPPILDYDINFKN